MAKITRDEVLNVANLARLQITDSETELFAGQIADILTYIDMLNQVDTEGVTPTSHAVPMTNAFREDEETGHLNRDKALENAPEKEDGMFLVPKIIS